MKKNKYSELEKTLNISFKDSEKISLAFIHRSYLNEARSVKESNERLEFLGDSILSFLVSEHLFTAYPHFTEGELTNLRSSVVKTGTLAIVAKELNLGKFLLFSKGEEEGGGRKNPSLLADTFEAFIGVLYIDLGLKAVQQVLKKYLYPLFPQILEQKTYKDAKSIFQELVQEETKISPVYKVLSEKGPDHLKEFTVGVFVGNKLRGTGTGKSKQGAETRAAESALEKWDKK